MDAAIICFSEAIKLDPDLAMAYINRATCYIFHGKFDEAMADCTRVIELDPTNGLAYSYRAGVYDELGEYELSIEDSIESVGLAAVTLEGVLDAFRGVEFEVPVLTQHWTQSAHLPHQPLQDVGATAGVLR